MQYDQVLKNVGLTLSRVGGDGVGVGGLVSRVGSDGGGGRGSGG